MNQPATKPSRRWWEYLLIITAAGFICALGLLVYVNTESFQSLVRRRLIAEVERVTGGRVEIGSIHTIPFLLQADVRGITVHGRESATEVPLAHIDRIVARLKIISLLRSEFGFHEVILEQPVVHVAFYPDGSTNFPLPKATVAGGETAVERLFALSINRFELRHGQILWDDQTIPVDFAARDTSLRMDYYFLHRRYDGHLQVGLVDTKLMNCRPFAWMTSVEFSLGSDSAAVPSIKWNSGHSHFSASGQITNFRSPRVQGSYEALFDLTEAASIARRRELRAGVLEFKGHGDWSLDHFSSNGLLTVRDLAWQDAQVSFSRASLNTDYSLTDQQLKLSKLQARIFNGSVTGDAEFNQWLAPWQHLSPAAKRKLETAVISAAAPPRKSGVEAPRQKPPAIQNAVVNLRLHDLSAEDLAVALNGSAHALQYHHPAASASGTLETRWMGTPRDAEVQFAIDLTPPEHHVPGHLRISGACQRALPRLHWHSGPAAVHLDHAHEPCAGLRNAVGLSPQSAYPFPPPALPTGCPLSRWFAVPRFFQSS